MQELKSTFPVGRLGTKNLIGTACPKTLNLSPGLEGSKLKLLQTN